MIPVFMPACVDCKNRQDGDTGAYCPAYPDGIPRDIWEERIDVKSLSECKNGYGFEDKHSK